MAAANDRLAAELALLQSIYPDEVNVDHRSSEFRFKNHMGGFNLRLPDEYPSSGLPTLLSAHAGNTDVSGALRESIAALPQGEEMLDMIVERFNEIVNDVHANTADAGTPATKQAATHETGGDDGNKCTIIVWLHHLLNTNKRKQVLNPPGEGVSGLSKPGYPGVLVFSGPAQVVRQHVGELKSLNWAAFQVRLEEDDEWAFTHGSGCKEVESMGDVVKHVGDDAKRQAFLQAMKMK